MAEQLDRIETMLIRMRTQLRATSPNPVTETERAVVEAAMAWNCDEGDRHDLAVACDNLAKLQEADDANQS